MNTVDNKQDVLDSRDLIKLCAELRDELESLTEFCNEAAAFCPDWRYGATLIRDSYFEEYAQDLAEDMQVISNDVSWPGNCSDWKQAAHDLQQSYTGIEWSGVIYWIR